MSLHQPTSSRPSIRWRGRGGASTPPPGRCSSSVSIASVDRSAPVDEDDESCSEDRKSSRFGGAFSLRDLFRFDATRLRSAARREERILASFRAESASGGDPPKVSYVPHYGHEVCFVPDRFHYTAAELEPHRTVGDPELDDLLDFLSAKRAEGCGCGAFDDVIAHAAEEYRAGARSPARRFYEHYYEDGRVPQWVDFDQIRRGVDVFLAYFPAAGCALFYRSLVGGFSIPRIARVLVATRYLVPSRLSAGGGSSSGPGTIERDRRRSVERLMDTFGFLAYCVAPPASGDSVNDASATAALRPGGKGWEAALRVRVLHAKVRRSLLQSRKARSDGQSIPTWDVERDGIPINQEDTSATLLAFSANIITGVEIISGRPLPEREQRDYLALWRYLGWLLGVDTPEAERDLGRFQSSNSGERGLIPIDPCGPRNLAKRGWGRGNLGSGSAMIDPADDPIIHSQETLESVILHLLHPDEGSREIVTHLLGLERHFAFRAELCRKLLGDPLSDDLGIPRASIVWEGWTHGSLRNLASYAGVKFFLCLFLLLLRWYTLVTMMSPRLRSRAIAWHASLITKFLRTWEKKNAKRMAKAASSRQGQVAQESSTSNSFCPFSMVMAPNSVSLPSTP